MIACKYIADRCLHGVCLALLLISSTADANDALTARLLSLRNLPIPEMSPQKEWKASSLQKISPTLLEFNEAVSKGTLFSSDLQETAKSLGIAYEDERVAVTLAARSAFETNALSRSIQEMGGEVTTTFENTVFAMIPARSIAGLEQAKALDYARPQTLYLPTATNRSPNEGGKVTGVERLHAAGITGKGVKIGIIDFGFQNYQKLVNSGAAPQPKAARAFNKKNSMENRGSVHGSACAEIIHAMAPDAEIYLASIDGRDDQIIQAAAWLVQQGVNIISFSGGGHSGPMNGTDILSRYIDKIVKDSGDRLLWVNAAGNEADEHWMGLTVDSNHDNKIDVPVPEFPANGMLILTEVHGPIVVLINWDDWGSNPERPSASIDIDAEMYRVDGKNITKVAASNNPQSGRGEPQEIIILDKPSKNNDYIVYLLPRKVNRQVKIHVTVKGAKLHPLSADGSIGSPATARMALAVGAVDVTNQQLEEFSSQGPTDDGRLKPEISAPDNTLSLAYQSVNEERFLGTSAACPHVSGYSALLKQMQPDISRDELIKRIIAYATPMGEGRPNNQYGYGHISATNIDLAGNAPPSTTGGSASSGRGNGRVFQPILDIMKQSGQ